MSALNLNKVTLCGRLTADVELKQTTTGTSVVSFTLAVNRLRARDATEQKADFLKCIAWEKTAEFIAKYFHKGESLYIEGSLQTRKYKTSTGLTAYATEVNVTEARFVDNKQTDSAQLSSGGAPHFEETDPDADLPF